MNAMGLGADLDAGLVEAARRGSDAAFQRIVARHQQAVRAFLRRLGGDAAEADDLAQETFITAWSALDRFRGQSSLRSWLCGIAYRKRLGQRRGRRRAETRDAQFLAEAARSGGEGGGSADDRLDLARAMAELPLEQRAAVSLCLAADFSHAEAADALHLPLGTVKSHVARGRAKLLQALSPEEGEHERS
jgi:RNA polymerase sigma factor (sigma-70 family)